MTSKTLKKTQSIIAYRTGGATVGRTNITNWAMYAYLFDKTIHPVRSYLGLYAYYISEIPPYSVFIWFCTLINVYTLQIIIKTNVFPLQIDRS